MLKKAFIAVAFACLFIGQVFAQNEFPTPTPGKLVEGFVSMCLNSAGQAVPCNYSAGTYSIQAYGVVGDGTTDDTAAFAAALAACAVTGGTVTIGPSRYLINSATIVIPPNCRLSGNFYPGMQRNNLNFQNVPFTLLVNPSFTIQVGNGGTAGGSELRGVLVMASNMTTPTTFRQGLTLVAGFSGTGITVGGSDAAIRDVTVIGFNQCVGSTGFGRVVVDTVYMDCINGVNIDNSHDTSRISNSQVAFYTTVSIPGGSTLTYAVSGVANNGGGLYRITVPANILVTGDVINFGSLNINALNTRQTITVVDATHFDIQGSVFGGPTTTGNLTVGQAWVPVTSTANIGPGQTVTGTGIPGGTTVTAVWQNQNIVVLSAVPTIAGTGVSLAFGDPAYTSGGTVVISALSRRGGKGFSFTNGETLWANNLVSEGPDVGFYVGVGAGWFNCTNCGVDTNGVPNSGGSDPALVGLWFDSTSYFGSYQGLLSGSTSVRNTSTGSGNNTAHTVHDSVLGTNTCPFCNTLELAGNNPIVITGNEATNSVGNCLLASGVQPVTLSNNNLPGCTAYFQNYTALNQVTGSGNTFAGTATLIPSTPQVFGSFVVNGDMAIDQPNEGASVGCVLVPDRWRCASNNGSTFTFQRVADAPAGYVYSMKITSTAAQTVSAAVQNQTTTQLEGSSLANLNWGSIGALPIAVDWWAKSSLTGTFTFYLNNAGGTQSYLIPYAVPVANTWTKFCTVVPAPASSFGNSAGAIAMFVGVDLGNGSNSQSAVTNAWQSGALHEITGNVQLGANNGATLNIAAVHIRQGSQNCAPYFQNPYEIELQRAQRFYRKSFPLGTAVGQNKGVVGARCTTNPIAAGRPSIYIPFEPSMETTPTVTTYNPSAANANWRDVTAGADITVTVDPATAIGPTGVHISTGATVAIANDTLCIHYTADTVN